METNQNLNVKIATGDFESLILVNLIQDYEKEFSKITKKIPGKDGKYPLDIKLAETDNFIFFFNEMPVGFCIKGNSNGRNDIFEFYIEPNVRNQKLGSKFAQLIFNQYPGPWQVRQISGAGLAKQFWIKTISEFSHGHFSESIVYDQYWGQMSVQTFDSIAKANAKTKAS